MAKKDGGFVIQEKADTKRIYAGPDKGWIHPVPPEPPDPMEHAVIYDNKEDAERVIRQHGMQADVVEK